MKRIVVSIIIGLLLLPVENVKAQSVGLVMSGGGARGMAHIGVIRSLEENKIPIDYVTGTSMGAIIAALYSMGYTPDEMEAIIESEDFHHWYTGTMDLNYMFYFRHNNKVPELININFDITDSLYLNKPSFNIVNPNPMSFGVMQTFAQYTAACENNFDSLFVPFRSVAADTYHKKQIIFKNGDLGDAVRASMSYPIVFKPIMKDSVLLYDGGIYNNFPADVMEKEFNPDIIIGSVVSKNAPPPGEDDIMSQVETMVMGRSNYTLPAEKGILINMPMEDVTLLQFDKLKYVSGIGYNKMNEFIDSVKTRVHRRSDSTELAKRRMALKKRLPEFRFRKIEVEGATEEQAEYIKSEFHEKGEIFDLQDCKSAYFRLLSGNIISEILPRAIYNPADSTFTLHLKIKSNPPFSLKMGGGISSTNSNQIYFGLHYRNLQKRSKEFILNGQLGKVYNNVQLSGRFDFTAKVPFSIKLIGSFSTFDYYNMRYLFSKENAVALNHEREAFVKMKLTLPFLMRKKAEFGIGFGNIKDEYIPSSIIDLNRPRFDVNRINLFGGSIKFEGNTLNTEIYPTAGTYESLLAQFFVGKEKYHSYQREERGKFYPSWLQMSYMRKDHFKLTKRFTLGTLLHIYYSTRDLSESYQATMMQAGVFAPTMNSIFNYDPKFRANQFVGGGIMPIFKINNFLQIRAGFYGFAPYRKILENQNGEAYFSKRRFNDFQYITDFTIACKFSNLTVSAFVDRYSSHDNGVNIGITMGWFLFNERFIE